MLISTITILKMLILWIIKLYFFNYNTILYTIYGQWPPRGGPALPPVKIYARKSKFLTIFDKIKSKNRGEKSRPNPIFGVKTFFQTPPETFLRILWPCSRYLEGPPSHVLYANKKIRVIRHAYQNIFAKMRKKSGFRRLRIISLVCRVVLFFFWRA